MSDARGERWRRGGPVRYAREATRQALEPAALLGVTDAVDVSCAGVGHTERTSIRVTRATKSSLFRV